MKIAVISDIHSNPTALLQTLADAKKQECGRVVCLGDIVGYGYDPNGCIEICRQNKIECYLGNHDAAIIGKLGLDWFNPFAEQAIRRQSSIVTEDNKKWLEGLAYNQLEHKEDNFHIAFSHGTYTTPEDFKYIEGYFDAEREAEKLMRLPARVLFVGHTHYAETMFVSRHGGVWDVGISLEDEEITDLGAFSDCAIVNVGSCGYPRNQPYTIYGIYEDESHLFKYRILPFDFDDYTKNMKKSGAQVPLWVPTQKREAEMRPIRFL